MRYISSIKEKVKAAEGKSRALHYVLEKRRFIKRRIIEFRRDTRYRKKTRKETFQDIYKNDTWGYVRYETAPSDFYSGPGSYADGLVNPYVSMIKEFVSEKGIKTIVDLGCGDFNVGSKIAPLVDEYIGCDVVPELIERNIKKYSNDRCKFVCLDIVDDDLPIADLCLIREVFQHLNNKEIMQVLPKLHQYKYVLITETIISSEEGVNKDITHGRYRGVSLEKAPFYMTGTEMLRLEHPHEKDSIVVSTLYKHEDQIDLIDTGAGLREAE